MSTIIHGQLMALGEDREGQIRALFVCTREQIETVEHVSLCEDYVAMSLEEYRDLTLQKIALHPSSAAASSPDCTRGSAPPAGDQSISPSGSAESSS